MIFFLWLNLFTNRRHCDENKWFQMCNMNLFIYTKWSKAENSLSSLIQAEVSGFHNLFDSGFTVSPMGGFIQQEHFRVNGLRNVFVCVQQLSNNSSFSWSQMRATNLGVEIRWVSWVPPSPHLAEWHLLWVERCSEQFTQIKIHLNLSICSGFPAGFPLPCCSWFCWAVFWWTLAPPSPPLPQIYHNCSEGCKENTQKNNNYVKKKCVWTTLSTIIQKYVAVHWRKKRRKTTVIGYHGDCHLFFWRHNIPLVNHSHCENRHL